MYILFVYAAPTQTSQSNPIALHYAVVCALWSFTVTAPDVLTIMHWFSEHFMHINITYKKCTLVTCFHSNLTNLSCSSNGYTSRHILHWHMHDKTVFWKQFSRQNVSMGIQSCNTFVCMSVVLYLKVDMHTFLTETFVSHCTFEQHTIATNTQRKPALNCHITEMTCSVISSNTALSQWSETTANQTSVV